MTASTVNVEVVLIFFYTSTISEENFFVFLMWCFHGRGYNKLPYFKCLRRKKNPTKTKKQKKKNKTKQKKQTVSLFQSYGLKIQVGLA
jgi:hypothetical protein